MDQQADEDTQLEPAQHPALQQDDTPEERAEGQAHADQSSPAVVEDPRVVKIASPQDHAHHAPGQDQQRAIDRPKLLVEVSDGSRLNAADFV